MNYYILDEEDSDSTSLWSDFDDWYADITDPDDLYETHYEHEGREDIQKRIEDPTRCSKCGSKLECAVGVMGTTWWYCPKCEP